MADENIEVDVFSMSSEEFAALDIGSLGTDNSSEEPNQEEQSDEVTSTETIKDDTSEDDTQDEDNQEPDTENQEDEDTDQEESEEDDESDSETLEEEVDYKSIHDQLFAEPIKAAGKEYKINNVDEAKKLIQMGIDYYGKVSALKPTQKIISMLENAQVLDEDKLSFAIDLLNKNPKAINQLVKDMDLSEIMDDTNTDYKPTDHKVDEATIAVDNALKEISTTPTYTKTVTVLGKTWDDKSRQIVEKNPQVIGLINQQIAEGVFDIITQEVEKQRMLGNISSSLSDIEAYKQVGDSLYANPVNQSAPHTNGQQSGKQDANVNTPIRKPSRDNVVSKKKAASKPRATSTVSKEMEDVFAMSSEEFNKKYSKYN